VAPQITINHYKTGLGTCGSWPYSTVPSWVQQSGTCSDFLFLHTAPSFSLPLASCKSHSIWQRAEGSSCWALSRGGVEKRKSQGWLLHCLPNAGFNHSCRDGESHQMWGSMWLFFVLQKPCTKSWV
jgi:hypothetical protein